MRTALTRGERIVLQAQHATNSRRTRIEFFSRVKFESSDSGQAFSAALRLSRWADAAARRAARRSTDRTTEAPLRRVCLSILYVRTRTRSRPALLLLPSIVPAFATSPSLVHVLNFRPWPRTRRSQLYLSFFILHRLYVASRFR